MTNPGKTKGLRSGGPDVVAWVVPVLVLLALGGVWRWKQSNKDMVPVSSSQMSVQAPLFDAHDLPMTIIVKGVDLASGKFIGNKAVIRQSKTRYNQMKQTVLAYLHGPREGKFQVPVPQGMELNQFFMTGEGIAVVDLSMAGVKHESFGFYEEVLFVRGIIETLTSNFFEVRQVKLLVDGQNAQLLGGHYALGTTEVNMPVSQTISRNLPTVNAP